MPDNEYPTLHPDELAELQKMIGMPITNDEAQIFLREKAIWDAWQNWLERKKEGVL